uniref:Integrase catalytic domain-containing protein n=1 Tax=Tanacetum cinerariifolium TaxID=118510 RepID=A0A699HD08_TANCI|nr:hypothetical protein [Tanacetum cinerariifolium]
MSSVRTSQQNGVVEQRNRTLVEAARTMLIFSRAPLFLWAEAIATACFTQNCSIIHRRFNKTPYELINGRKPDISFLHVFGALCYPKNDREDIGKLGAKGDIGFFIGYSADSCAYKIYNRRTKKIIETMNVLFDELLAMAFEQCSSKPGLQCMTSGQISSGLDLTYASSTIMTQQPTEGELDSLFEAMYDDYFGGQPSATVENVPPVQEPQVHQTVYNWRTKKIMETMNVTNLTPWPIASTADDVPNVVFEGDLFVNPFATPSTESVVSSTQYVDPSNMHTFYQPYPYDYQWTKDHPLEQVIREPFRPVLTRNQLKTDGDMCIYALTVIIMELKTVKEAFTIPAWIESMQEELPQFIRLNVWELVPSPDSIKPLTFKWLLKNKHDEENTMIRNKTRLVVRGYRQEEGLVHTAKTKRPQPKGNSRNARVPFASKRSEVKKNVTVEDHRRILLLSKNLKTMSFKCNNIKLAIQNDKSKIVCGCLNFSMVRLLGLFQAYDQEHQASHQLCVEVLGTICFGNDHIAAIFGYSDLKWGNITITRVYFVKGLGHNLFSVGQFYDADLDVAFRRNTCFIRDLDGVDLLKVNRFTNLYTINLYDMASASPICLMAMQLLLSRGYGINDYPTSTLTPSTTLSKMISSPVYQSLNMLKNIFVPLVRKEKAKEPLTHPNRFRIQSSGFTCFIWICVVQSHVIIVRTGNETELKNHVLKEYFNSVGITHETSGAKTSQQNGVVERRNRTLVEAARTMLIFSHAPLFLWAEAIATAKPDISDLHVFGALCYPKNDREDIDKLGAKGDTGFFIGYSADSVAYRVYNRRTKKIMETMNVTFDELLAMAFEQNSSRPGLQSMTSRQISSELELTYSPSTITPQRPNERDLDILFEQLHNEYLGGQQLEAPRIIPAAPVIQNLQAPMASMSYQDSAPAPTNSSNTPVSAHNVDEPSQQHAQQQRNLTLSPTASAAENVPNVVFEGDLFVNPFATPSTESGTKDHPLEQVIGEPSRLVLIRNQLKTDGDMCIYALTVGIMELKSVKDALIDPAWIKSMQEELYQFIRLDVWELVLSLDGIKPLILKWLFKNKHDEENTVFRNKTRLVVRGYQQEEGIEFEESFALALYGLKQAPRAWYDELSTFLLQNGFSKGTIDPTLFTRRFDDDILVVNQFPSGIFINQSNYVNEILKKYGLNTCDVIGTPMDIKDKLELDQIGTPVDATKYRSMIGALMYLTSSRLDIVHATCDFGFELTGFSDADYAGCKDTFKSTSESEYVSLSACCAQVLWMRTQLADYGYHFDTIPIYYDSKSAIAISYNPVQCSRMKHIAVQYHFIKEHVEKGTIELQNRRDLPKDTPIDRLEVLRYDIGKRSKVRMGIMATKTELTLEQTQQGAL